MNLDITTVSGRMALRGELDLATAPLVHAEFAHQGARVLDVADVTFIDCSGIRALLELSATRPGLRIENPPSMLVRLLGLLDLTDQVLGPLGTAAHAA